MFYSRKKVEKLFGKNKKVTTFAAALREKLGVCDNVVKM
jgi:hypothetical protein